MRQWLSHTYFLFIFFLPYQVDAQLQLELETMATNFASPVEIANAGDDRLFIVERRGRIQVIDTLGNRQSTAFLDIDSRVHNTGGQSEQGLLGLAFHPDYKNNGYFYVNYTDNDDSTRISRFSVSSTDSSQADPNSEVVLLAIDQPFANHNGGDLCFGPDGYLYIGTGDGGSGGDPGNRAQNRQLLLGKMLRLDVDSGSPYGVPPNNPFVGDTTTLDEIWAIGLRNPWRHSFDRLTGDFWIADVGQNAYEEVNFQPFSSTGGENYGWRCYEANVPFNTNGCGNINDYQAPVAAYFHNGFEHCSVTGGYVYRGSKFPTMYGHYLFADFCSGRFWATRPDGNGWQTDIVANYSGISISSFGEDAAGELYAVALNNGILYRVSAELCSGVTVEGTVTDVSCNGGSDGAIELNIDTDRDTFTLSWSPELDSLQGLSANSYTLIYSDNLGCQLEQTFVVGEPDVMSINDDLITYAGDSLLTQIPAGSNYTLQWTLNGEVIAGATEPVYFPTTSGNYSVIFFDVNGCEVFLNQVVQVILSSLDGLVGFEHFTVRPSLFRESLIVELQTSRSIPIQLQLINNSGQVLRETNFTAIDLYQQIWSTTELPAGVYFVRLITEQGNISEKVIKLK